MAVDSPWRQARQRAARLLRSPGASRRLAMAAAAKAWRQRDRLGEEAAELRLMAAMLRDWALRRYPEVPWATLVTLAGVLVYFLMPLDAIPDAIIGLGLIDDLALLHRSRRWIGGDLDAYRRWRGEHPDVQDPPTRG
ncbi:YkvA family protein [Alloalcanivorax mobilis]|uniref:YkvA family protein n=1 Tax=Alloalcanivorax mobilis TaxID=2019569 RepID=UPI000B5B2F32|nr:DUF1232 domain-containing protein [Alloalcanivorax mobilis]ASK33806.1 hypothetical protein CEK62_05080 [Alcanivorax sp. N3-2A]|tara:strand:- start:43818 stop:44228 length:411 start_codon:yes stop_codon:yes gene_type:complete